MEDNEVRNEEDSTSKQAYVNSYSSNGKQTAKGTSDFIKFYAVLGLFKANSGHLQNVYRL